MDIIIMGLGAVGLELTESLSAKNGINVTVIDNDEQKVEKAVDNFDVIGITGNGITFETLKEAKVSKAEILIATTSQDELNILCCVMGKKFGAKTTIARISETDYFKLIDGDNGLDIDLMVNPQHEAAKEIRRILRFPSAIHVDKFSNGKVELVEFKVVENSPLCGVMLKELHYKFKNRVLVCAAIRGEEEIIPSGDFVIEEGDHIFVTGTKLEITGFFKEIGLNKQAKNVLIVGGSKTACYLADELHKNNIHATIIEKDYQKCQKLASLFPYANVIHGDGTNQQLLREEGVEWVDAFVALGDIDEQNIIMSMFAKSVGVPTIITKIDQVDYYKMLQTSGIDSVVSTKSSTADQLMRFVRNFGKRGNVVNLFSIVEDKLEALEFVADKKFKKLGVPIMDLQLKNDLIIAGIIRKDKLITPSGKDSIHEGDNVIIVTKIEALQDLNDIFDIHHTTRHEL
jgi:trk system potassium uptake protein TrkA